MYPDTRGRMSTDSTGSRRPVNSSHSFTSFSTTVTTLTGSGGALLFAADLLQPTTISERATNAARVNSRFTFAKSVDASSQRGTRCGVQSRRSKLQSDSLWQRHDVRRKRCELRADASLMFYCRQPILLACPRARRNPRHYRARAEFERYDQSTSA